MLYSQQNERQALGVDRADGDTSQNASIQQLFQLFGLNELIISFERIINSFKRIRLNELLIRSNELLIRIRLNELLNRSNELLIRLNELIIRLNQLIIRSNEITNSFKRNSCCMPGVRVTGADGAGSRRPYTFHNITSDKSIGS